MKYKRQGDKDMADKIRTFIRKHLECLGRIFLLIHTGIWFTIGAVLAYIFGIVPLLNRIEFLSDPVDVGSLMAIVIGFAGGVLWLVWQDKV